MRSVPVATRPLADALALGPLLLERARTERQAWMTASVSADNAIVLGAYQRAGRVVDLDRCAACGIAVMRRATSGPAAFVGEHSIVWTLALPDVATLVADATFATLLNRNLRGFLQGFARVGAHASYFGREWIATKHRPIALTAYNVTPDGGVLIEVLAGFDQSIGLPGMVCTSEERAVDRWRGRTPITLSAAMRTKRSPHDVALHVMESVASRAGLTLVPMDPVVPALRPAVVRHTDDPVPAGAIVGPPVRCAIGYVEAAWMPVQDEPVLWLGGDMLAGGYALKTLAGVIAHGGHSEVDTTLPFEGARLQDLHAAAKAASHVGGAVSDDEITERRV